MGGQGQIEKNQTEIDFFRGWLPLEKSYSILGPIQSAPERCPKERMFSQDDFP